jgi:AcrR family transcriptional regulator
MAENKTRKPSQKRSIAKREKIIDAGFDLICTDGYFNTDTAKIAKKAGVSTGIVYQYFKDKRDILIASLDKYSSMVFTPILSISPRKFNKEDLPIILKELFTSYITNNKMSSKAFKELKALSHYDEAVEMFFLEKQKEIAKIVSNILIDNGFDSTNIKEKVFSIIGIADYLCNGIIYNDLSILDLNYEVMLDIVIDEIKEAGGGPLPLLF